MDLCSLLAPGEGLLVGSFAGGLFLVHSECAESKYINSRPFRINAGPVWGSHTSCSLARVYQEVHKPSLAYASVSN